MVKLSLTVQGRKLEVECAEGTNCSDAIVQFKAVAKDVLNNVNVLDTANLYDADGNRLNSTDEAPKEMIAVKSKHESA